MTAILVSPTEPDQLKSLGATSSVPEKHGADVLIPGEGFLVGVQRKVFPADFLASLSDGRGPRWIMALSELDMGVLVLEGRPKWTFGGQLLGEDYGPGLRFNRVQLRGYLWSLFYQFGITHMWTDDVMDTYEVIRELARWAGKSKHDSLMTRPGPPKQGMRKRVSERDWAIHLLQGVPGLGPEMAGRVYDHFGKVPLEWTATRKELLAVEGIGPGRVEKMMGVLK